jgi:surface antigen
MPTMAFGRKRKEAPQQQQSAPPAGSSSPWQSYGGGAGGYVVTELPYYDKGKRKIMVYTSDASGKIIKTFKR